jgi:tRNA (adenine37-N6)-methyltransferase
MICKPIGVIHSPFQAAAGAPIQPRAAKGVEGTVKVLSALADGLKDLQGFERIWLIYCFDRTGFDKDKLIVTPYLDKAAHGVFATRAPARPNPIGISAVRLLEVCGNVLRVCDLDVLDGTPLLDIKPYVPQFDCFENARSGWVGDRVIDGKVADGRFGRSEKPRKRPSNK